MKREEFYKRDHPCLIKINNTMETCIFIIKRAYYFIPRTHFMIVNGVNMTLNEKHIKLVLN